MGTIGTIASIIAAAVGLAMYWNSKPMISRRIDRKERQLWRIEQEINRQYGVCNQHRPLVQTPLDRKTEKLQRQIDRLKSYLQ